MKYSECEALIANTFTLTERQTLCDSLPGSMGPAQCAQEAQSELGMYVFSDILGLCSRSASTAPVMCRKMLQGKQRAKYGDEVCGNSQTSLPGECFKTLTQGLRRNAHMDDEDAVAFCKELSNEEARGAMTCVEAAVKTKLLKGHLSLEPCQNALGMPAAIEECIEYFAKLPRVGNYLQPTDAVRFCAESAAPSPGACFNAVMEHPSLTYAQMTAADMAELCLYASAYERDDGPAQCMAFIQDSRKFVSHLTHEAAITLCQGAPGAGPAQCYEKSKGLASEEDRLELCHGALSTGVADCYRWSKSVFRPESRMGRTGQEASVGLDIADLRKHLCLGSHGSEPAECVSASPHYLGNEERLQLCVGTLSGRSSEPGICLDRVATVFRRFKGADSMALGYFLANVLDEEVRQSRTMLINMCSFGAMDMLSSDVRGGGRGRRLAKGSPLYAAECLSGAPVSMLLDDAVRMCTNAANAYVPEDAAKGGKAKPDGKKEDMDWHEQGNGKGEAKAKAAGVNREDDEACTTGAQPVNMCVRMLPRDWTSAQVSALCGGGRTANRNVAITGAKVDSVVACVTAVLGPTGSGRALGWGVKLSREDAIALCRTEMPGSPVVTCARAAVKETSQRSQQIKVDLLLEVCAGAGALQEQLQSDDDRKVNMRSANAGTCMGRISADHSLQMDVGVASRICFSDAPLAKMQCLQQARTHKDVLSLADADKCAQEERRVASATVSFKQAQDNSPHAVAGKWFALDVTLLDQWGLVFDAPELSVVASLDLRNSQGAVLWGLRSNQTDDSGSTVLERVVVSQPGPVKLLLHTSTPTVAAAALQRRSGFVDTLGKKKEKPVLVAAMKILVRRDADAVDPAPCLFMFREQTCPLYPGAGADTDSLYPVVRGFLPAALYGRVLGCADALRKWHVEQWVTADGGHVTQYRAGIEAIWTGNSFPSQEQTPEERLELPGLTDKLVALFHAPAAATTTANADANATDVAPVKLTGKASRRAKSINRELRSAYYRKSLMWHPDRWAGMPIYSEAVQGAFQLITDAYGQLMRLTEEPAAAADTNAPGSDSYS